MEMPRARLSRNSDFLAVRFRRLWSRLGPFAFYVYGKALNLLVQGGQRDTESFGGFSLAPGKAFQVFHDGLSLKIGYDFKERGVGWERVVLDR